MSVGWLLLVLVAAVGLAAVFARKILRRLRRVRRLENSEASVAKAVADGRLPRATGEALLQHLEGLRRECSEEKGS
ncbi:MAG: hypothetical protein QNL88_07090 [Acidobacteriota bacterium]|nr:hypothetical protein [Acidobacteriota bacterium]